MGLPLSMEFTFSASDPVLAAVLNKLQEANLGDLHPDRTLVLGAAAWQSKPAVGRGAGGVPPVLGTDRHWVWGGSAPSIVFAPISNLVPVGHELTSVTWCYDSGGVVNAQAAIWTRNILTGAADAAIIGPYNLGAGTPWATTTDDSSLAGYIMPAGTAVELEFNLTNAAHKFGGAVVTYRKIP